MKKQNKLTYETPTLTVVEFRTERGFAESQFTFNAAQRVNMFIDNEMRMERANDGTDGNLVGGYMSGHEDHSGDGAGGGGWQYENGGWF